MTEIEKDALQARTLLMQAFGTNLIPNGTSLVKAVEIALEHVDWSKMMNIGLFNYN